MKQLVIYLALRMSKLEGPQNTEGFEHETLWGLELLESQLIDNFGLITHL